MLEFAALTPMHPPTQEWRSLSKCSDFSHAQQSGETDVQATVELREM